MTSLRVWGLLSWFVLPLLSAPPTYTLPNTVTPLRETLELTIDPAQDHFQGIARISVRLSSPQSEIWLNGRDLTVDETWIELPDANRIEAKAQLAGGEFISLTPERAISSREATLVLRYHAPLSAESSTGPYHAKTADDWYVFTTFTPTDGRRAFPCFDEPRFKVPWELSLHIPGAQRGFTNAPQVSETPAPNGWKLLHFAPTKPLAAEVVAFAVGPFDVWEGRPAGANNIPIRVLTARGNAKAGEVAALQTLEILPRLERYTGIPYPWEKLDHVALPRSAFGAVENPGLITYNGRALLSENGIADPDRRRSIRSLQAHEIGHQWFGNLVTQASWTDVWLSEGFATWFAARTMSEEQPEDRKNLSFAAAREAIMRVDDGPQTRPVRLERRTREELQSVYSRVVYQKGGSLLFMLENWIGSGPMQAGLRSYLGAHAYGNATTEDLEASLRAAAAQVKASELTAVMEGFLNGTGVPRVSAQVHCEGAPSIELTRKGGHGPFPVCWRSGGTQSCAVLSDSVRVTLSGAAGACPNWVYPNSHGAGYYRVAWTPEQIVQLKDRLPLLDGGERLTLVYDIQALHPVEGSLPPESEALLRALLHDQQPEVVRSAKVALGLK